MIVYNFTYDDISIGLFIGEPADSKGLLDQYEVEVNSCLRINIISQIHGSEYKCIYIL